MKYFDSDKIFYDRFNNTEGWIAITNYKGVQGDICQNIWLKKKLNNGEVH